jgi:hypothetical protein
MEVLKHAAEKAKSGHGKIAAAMAASSIRPSCAQEAASFPTD